MHGQLTQLNNVLENENNHKTLGRIICQLRTDVFPLFKEAAVMSQKSTNISGNFSYEII